MNFNSTIVRLKARLYYLSPSSQQQFQFYDSTIKRPRIEHGLGCNGYFNSTIVRLKAGCRVTDYPLLTDFNSTIVRLKVGMGKIHSD